MDHVYVKMAVGGWFVTVYVQNYLKKDSNITIIFTFMTFQATR